MPEKRVTTRVRHSVAKRAHECCEYCQGQVHFSGDPYVIEHITPKSRGGTGDLGNLAFACSGCNSFKYNKTSAEDPVTGEIVPLFNPRQSSWNEHFAWSQDFTLIIGLTPSGRATVEALQLNRDGAVNLRKVLFAMGEHPPKV
jgi:5-methylcytosine-specific restriction endonuclease McrA